MVGTCEHITLFGLRVCVRVCVRVVMRCMVTDIARAVSAYGVICYALSCESIVRVVQLWQHTSGPVGSPLSERSVPRRC